MVSAILSCGAMGFVCYIFLLIVSAYVLVAKARGITEAGSLYAHAVNSLTKSELRNRDLLEYVTILGYDDASKIGSSLKRILGMETAKALMNALDAVKNEIFNKYDLESYEGLLSKWTFKVSSSSSSSW